MDPIEVDFSAYKEVLSGLDPIRPEGKIREVIGNLIVAHNPGLQIGDLCRIFRSKDTEGILAEVVGFRGEKAYVMPLGSLHGVGPDSRMIQDTAGSSVPLGEELLGRVIDGLGNPLDDLGPLRTNEAGNIYRTVINPLHRKRITEPLDIGVRAINGLLTVGMGQRIGILAGSGVGKSVLLGMISRNTSADINVIGLVGERGREVKEFIEKDLGVEGLKKSVVIAATSDQSPLVRMRGAFIAMTIAEYFRDLGNNVLLTMDSITRFAMAQREIGLSVGEPPTTKGYPPSVFSTLPKLLERAGNTAGKGSLTGLFTVLVEGDDMNEPIGDAVRSIVDGHIILDRKIAATGHYPAIDILNSKSRTMVDVVDKQKVKNAALLTETYSVYQDAEDLINIGAYVKGANPKIDYSVTKIAEIDDYLTQDIEEKSTLEESFARLGKIIRDFPQPGVESDTKEQKPKLGKTSIAEMAEARKNQMQNQENP